jgi:hypothetical protein
MLLKTILDYVGIFGTKFMTKIKYATRTKTTFKKMLNIEIYHILDVDSIHSTIWVNNIGSLVHNLFSHVFLLTSLA